MAPEAESREVTALLPLDQESGVHNLHRACTWFFRAKARLEPAKIWNDVLNCERTVASLTVDGKQIQVDYVGNSEEHANKTINMQTRHGVVFARDGSLATW